MTIEQALHLAVQHHQAGRLAEAEALYRQILALQPAEADALHLLGVIALQRGQLLAASDLISRSLTINPRSAAARSNLSDAWRRLGRLDDAVAECRRALDLEPNYPEACNHLGLALAVQGDEDQAIAAYRRALELRPGFAEAHYNLANVLKEQGRIDEAIAGYQRALEHKPHYFDASVNLGNALKACGRLDEAFLTYRHALEIAPGNSVALNNLGSALKLAGSLPEAIASFRAAIAADPGHPVAYSNLIYTLHFAPGDQRTAISDAQRAWHRQLGESANQCPPVYAHVRNPERPLRIGYVSPEFRDHVTGRYLVPLFQCHDREQFQIVCYSGVTHPDRMTEDFRRRAHLWRNTVGVPDDALAETIHADGIDILVDLTQHLAGNRLPVFARRPAPLQLSFAGYPESTGVEAIEYRVSDQWLEGDLRLPIGDCRLGEASMRTETSEAASTLPYLDKEHERVYLLDSFWCYDPCGLEVPVNELPAIACGHVTFGCLNNFCKVNEPVLHLWSRVLRALPETRLLLLSSIGSHRQRTLDFFAMQGISASRIEFVAPCPRQSYLELYHRVDVALDTFPYNGHTTSLDALWMGVPVVSLAGNTAVSRAGSSQLSNLGLPELAAFTEDTFVETATVLARHLPRIAELRRTLRPRLESSVLMDAPRFAREIEAIYRTLWRHWCAGH
jgi:predicted O-linked N-acetylglucosamine transferase (SPINDLY family)